MNDVDLILVGHYTHDRVILPDGEYERLGGPPAYMAPFLKAAGVVFHVVSKVGRDFRYTADLPNAVAIVDTPTTCFSMMYGEGERVSRCAAVCAPIFPGEITIRSRIAIACGVLNEIPPETVRALRTSADILLGDLQGFCRRRNAGNVVELFDPLATPFREVLPLFDYVKCSASEAAVVNLSRVDQQTVVLVTNGGRGCTIRTEDRLIECPAESTTEVDSTGAGDAFLAGFALGLLREWPLEDCARLANHCGAITVRAIGVPVVTPDDLLV